ncbi:Flagellar basal-body rod protein FlgC [Phycisphaerales bacterium]|nr:Flagellar basal-body rod protein FlgC [Phycisphaerales bacterium]
MYGMLDISTSGMIAQRERMTAIAANLANRSSLEPDGTPYRARQAFFAAGDPRSRTPHGRKMGVHIDRVEVDQSPFNLRWDPSDPRAMKTGPQKGYVQESNVNPIVEQVNAIQASRAYEANVVAAEATKSMMAQALRLIA